MSGTEFLPAQSGRPERRPRRRATTMDAVRVRELLARVERGDSELDAFWGVASDPGIGLSRYRGAAERPAEAILRRKMASLLARTVPDVVGVARDLALAKLAGLSDGAVQAVTEIVGGDFEDGRAARVRLDAAKAVLQSLGIGERAGPVIATQVNVQGAALGGVPEGA